MPDVCVVDVRMPPTFTDEGVRAALVIRREFPQGAVRVLAQGRTSRVICYRDGRIVDLDIDEGLAMKKTLDPEELAVMETMTGV